MIVEGINDDIASDSVKKFVRENRDILIYEFVNRGNNGDVYFGKRVKLGDEVVLKFYFSNDNYDDKEEAVILNQIDHPNILKIYDLKFFPPFFAYFLSPKIKGGDLQNVIDSNGVSTRTALKIIEGILMGLTEFHSKHQLVHRDLKPGNILISSDNLTPIIADLGAVKKIKNANDPVTASKSTFLYLPPESVIKNEYYYESDIYQVGIILFQMLGGSFHLENPSMWCNKKEKKELDQICIPSKKQEKLDEIITNKIRSGKLIDSSTLPAHLDQNFKKVINKATNFHYEKRYSNPSLFLKDIHKLLRSQPDYNVTEDFLYISHQSGKEFRISKTPKMDVIMEKRADKKKEWRKDNTHEGSITKAYEIAKKM